MPLITTDENRLLIGSRGAGRHRRAAAVSRSGGTRTAVPAQSRPLPQDRSPRGPFLPQPHVPEPTGSLRCRGQMLLTLEPTDGRAGAPIGLARSCVPPATSNTHPAKSHPVSTLPPRGSPFPVGDPKSHSVTAPQSPGDAASPGVLLRKEGRSREEGEPGKAIRRRAPSTVPPATAGAARCHPSSLVKEPPRHRSPASPR